MTDDTHMSRTQKRDQRDFENALKGALSHAPTRVVMRWILEVAGTFDQSFTGNSTTFYNEGRRSVALELMAAMNTVDPYEVVRLMKEGADEVVERRNKERRSS